MVSYTSASVSQVMQPAGAEAGILSTVFGKDPSAPDLKDDAGYKEWIAFMDKYYPDGKKDDVLNVAGYNSAMLLFQVLKQCGDTLTRENVMRQAANLDLQFPMMVSGVRVKTSPTDYLPLESLRLARYDGRAFREFGDLITVAEGK